MMMIPVLLIALLAPLLAKEQPVDVLSSLQKSYTQRSAKFPKPKGKALEGNDRTEPLLHLRYLLEMESVLREHLFDKTTLQKQVNLKLFSASEKRRILEMREESNQHRATSLTSPNFEEPRSNPVAKLHKAYEREARKDLLEISKIQKSLNKEFDRNNPDERRITKLERSIDELKQSLAQIQTAFFGDIPRKGFEPPAPKGAKGPAADLLVKVIASRNQLLKILRTDPKAVAKDGEVKKGEVGGISVRSSNLGVVLDHSTSMQPHLPELRKEINSGFPGSHFREVYGCALTWRAGPSRLGQRDHVLLAMEDLIIVMKADALYWFSDLRDPISPAGLFRLTELLDRSGALFYVSSVDQKPDNDLEDLITGFSKK